MQARFDADWVDSHPLTITDLELERVQLAELRLQFQFNRS
jgi:hypothetical protein